MKFIRILLFIIAAFAACSAIAQDKSIEEIAAMPDDSVKVNSLIKYFSKIYESNPPNSDSILDAITALSDKLMYEVGIAGAYLNKGLLLKQKGDFRESLGEFEKAKEIFSRKKMERHVQKANLSIATSYYRLSEFRKSDRLHEEILKYAETANDTDLLTNALHNLSQSYIERSRFADALKYSLKAIAMREKKGDRKKLATDYNAIGIILKELKRYKEAMEYYNKSIKLLNETGNEGMTGIPYMNLGNAYQMMKDYPNSITAYRSAIEVDKRILSRNLANDYRNLAQTFHEMKNNDSANYYLHEALELDRFKINERGMARIYTQLAEWAIEAEDAATSKAYLDSSEMLAVRTEQKQLFGVIQSLKSKLHAKDENMKQAYEDLQKSIVIKDSVYNLENYRLINELMTKYETEKKQNEINKLNAEKEISAALLERRQAINYSLAAIVVLILASSVLIYRNVQKKRKAEKQVAVLEKQNAIETMRSQIASDVHDDMGAGLTKMGLYSQQLLSGTSVSEKEKELLEKISTQSKEVIDGMREIIWASNPANDNLKSMLGFMRQYIDRFFDGTNIRPVINFPHDIGDVALHPEVRRNLFLILKESLNNAVKYSGSDKVDIDFNSEADKFNLNIKDYGKGIDDKNRDAFSNGLRNMQMRAEQIQSAFRLVTAPGKGVQIVVEGKLY